MTSVDSVKLCEICGQAIERTYGGFWRHTGGLAQRALYPRDLAVPVRAENAQTEGQSAAPLCTKCGMDADAADHCWRVGGHLGEHCGCRTRTLDFPPIAPEHYFESAAPVSVSQPKSHRSIATQLGIIYDTALVYARAAAFKHGYAIAVHGSEMRDLDLIAVPWTDEASDAETLVEAIREMTGGTIGQTPDEQRPHGRRSWSIHLNNEHTLGNFKPVLPYLDLSVMPRTEPAP